MVTPQSHLVFPGVTIGISTISTLCGSVMVSGMQLCSLFTIHFFVQAANQHIMPFFFCCIKGLVSAPSYFMNERLYLMWTLHYMQSSPVKLPWFPLFFCSCVRRRCPMGTSQQFSTAAATTAPHLPPSNCSSSETLQIFGRLYATYATNNRQEDCM